jgi:outer membrane protein TolC
MLKSKFVISKLPFLLILAINFQVSSQTVTGLSIDSCYLKARRNFPIVKQFGLIEKTKNYSLDNVSKGYLPQVTIGGQATYQSDVTQPTLNSSLPGGGTTPLFETISKDQYKIYGEAVQPITELFTLSNQKDLVEKNSEIEKQKLEVELYRLRERIDQVFFGMLLIDQQISQVELMKKDIQTGIDKTNAAIANGITLKSNLYLLQAEMLKADQRTIELQAARKSYADVLSLFIAEPITESTIIEKPELPKFSAVISRPEIEMYEIQKQVFDIQGNIVNARNLPRFSLFLQSGVGRPALNMLSNDFDFYYLGGLRLNWSLSSFYTSRKEKEILGFNQSSMDIQKETFLFNTNLTVKQQFNEAAKIESLIQTDSEIIKLRENIKTIAQSQLANGVISVNDYVSFVNAEDQARQNLLLHQTQLLMVLYNNRTTTGN